MKLENQVCSLELAKKLKELGGKQESLFYWHLDGDDEWELVMEKDVFPQVLDFCYPAFTVAELGEMLPEEIHTFKLSDEFCCESNQPDYFPKGKSNLFFTADTEANARAKMLIYLLENKLI